MYSKTLIPGSGGSQVSRMAEVYLLNLYPDRLDWGNVLTELSFEDIVEVGSGINHVDPYSLMNRLEVIRLLHEQGSYKGFDVMLGTNGEIHNFRLLQRIFSVAKITPRRILELVSLGTEPHCSMLGSKNAKYGEGHALPGIKDNSTDTVLSHWAFPAWTISRMYDSTIKKIYEVLRMDGQARLYPVRPGEQELLLSPFVKDKFDVDIRSPILAILMRLVGPTHRTLILTKQK